MLTNACENEPWNDPYSATDKNPNTLYMVFTSPPHHLDPARAYSEPEWRFLAQIYEPPLQYHYLKRPYTLEPLTASEMPQIRYFNEAGKELPFDAPSSAIKITEYKISIKPQIYYEPHPAFAKDQNGNYLYHHLTKEQASQYKSLKDFKENGTRELIADDYVYQIKRLADPNISSPIFGLMSNYIVGLAELRQNLMQNLTNSNSREMPLDEITLNEMPLNEVSLREIPFKGAEVLDRYTYVIRIQGKYPQFRFWLSMPFFAPIPWEAEAFFNNPGFAKNNMTLDWNPIGTGAYRMVENNPNQRICLTKNPNYHPDFYPESGDMQDRQKGFTERSGLRIPEVTKAVYTLEKESIPSWNKFLQGYYDLSGISSDIFSSAVQINERGLPETSKELKEKNVRLETAVTPTLWYWGFNMLDETVGGNKDRERALRQAISTGFDVQYFIDIFLNGRGRIANGPIPPDIFGFKLQKDVMSTMKMSKRLDMAKEKLKRAGYKPGFTLYMDLHVTGDPSEITLHNWIKEQFRRMGINLIIRTTDFNRFQQKLRTGTAQIFFAGWNADYPDPENFLFLFYGKNSAALSGGENISNYQNQEYDALFERMRTLEDNEERLQLIGKMLNILNNDQPAVWGFYPKAYGLYHQWMSIMKPSGIINNTLKYAKVDPEVRHQSWLTWNKPIIWPLFIMMGLILLSLVGFWFRLKKESFKIRRRM